MTFHIIASAPKKGSLTKAKEFCDRSGKFGKDLKIRGKSGNLKINGYVSFQKIYLLCSRGEMYFLER